jgi:hypothetical protein
MQYAFILKNGNGKQEADVDNGIKIEDTYKEVMSGVLAKLFDEGGLKNDNKDISTSKKTPLSFQG